MVEREGAELPLAVQAEPLGLSRASLYHRPVPPSPDEVALKHRIDALHTRYPSYGSRRIAAPLRREGAAVNRKAIQRHMREMGSEGIAPGPPTSAPRRERRPYPYLLRGLPIARPDHVWGVAITYIRLRAGWMYLVAVLDWYSRYVVAWERDQTLALGFVLAAMGAALARATPEICNSEQGSHFTSPQCLGLLTGADVRISMDGRGRALDNVFTERRWRSVKYEEVYLQDYASPKEARQGLGRDFAYYNHERPHQALGHQTPAAVYATKRQQVAAVSDGEQPEKRKEASLP